MDYYIISDDGQAIVLCKRDIVTPDVVITNPSRETNAKYGRYPYVMVTAPAAEDGRVVKQDGYALVDTDEGKVISENWRQLTVVDPYETIPDGKILRDDAWVIDGDTWLHTGTLLTVVDPYVTVPDGKILLHDQWDVVDDTYVHSGVLKNIVDNRPEIADNQRLDDLGWEETDEDYVHNYHVVTVIDEQPTEDAESGYHWEKVGETWDDPDTVRYVYEQVQDPPKPVLTISKMYFEIAVAKLGLLDQLDAYIDALDVPLDEDGHTIKARRLYDRAITFSTDNVYFQQFFTAGCQALGITEDAGWQVLLASQAE